MTHRPLIPALLSVTGGILAGHLVFAPHLISLLPFALLSAFTLAGLLFLPGAFRRRLFLLLLFLSGCMMDLSRHRESVILPLAEQRKRVTLEGTVIEPSRTSGERARFVLRAERATLRGAPATLGEDVLVTVYRQGGEFLPGERVRFPCRLRPLKNFNNPGCYDYRRAMGLRGIHCAASVSDGTRIRPLGKGDPGTLLGLLEGVRAPVRAFFRERLSPDREPLYRALVLGERQGITPELREGFNRAGVAHVLAVSGLHVGLVAWLIFFALKGLLALSYRLTLRIDIRKTAAILTCPAVILYALLAGFHVSTQRAMVMVLAYLFSMVLGREKEVWSTLALAALCVLIVDPHALFSISFQLSFGAVVGILWFTPTLYERISLGDEKGGGRKGIPVRCTNYFVGLASVTLCATLFLLPLTSYYFHRISLVAVPANLLVVPMLGLWVIPLGLAAVLLLPLSPSAASMALVAGSWGLEGMMRIVDFWASFPWASLWTITPDLFEIALFYALLFFIFFPRRSSLARIGLVVVLLLSMGDVLYWTCRTQFHRDLRITFLDVGQGNAALVQFPGRRRMLIDGGGFRGDAFDVGERVIAPFLLHSKIRRVDTLVLSHPQSDHMNGLRFIAAHFHVREFWSNGDRGKARSFQSLMEVIDREEIRRLFPSDIQKIDGIDGVRVALLHPDGGRKGDCGERPGLGLNDNSLVLRLSYGGTSCLFPGDLEGAGEAAVLSRKGMEVQSDVLLVPHHGSRTSSSAAFLNRVRPGLCVVSCGEGNPFGFPHPEALSRIRASGARTIRLDRAGATTVILSNGGWRVRTFNRDPSEGR
ncbi:MAG: DNA internalization-related competence protein ComEC/Rec2 [Deltaproteobacteria bacterium]|nr:DNA internalization-related competence protein ComEC/Rec2 [Deltaproteobacteria bacterium]